MWLFHNSYSMESMARLQMVNMMINLLNVVIFHSYVK